MITRNPFTNAKIIGANRDSDAYHKQDAERGSKEYVMSRSDLMSFAQCPHRWFMGYKRKESTAMDWGDYVDKSILSSATFITQPDKYPADGKKKGDPVEMKDWHNGANWCKDWVKKAEKDGGTVLPKDEIADINLAVANVMLDPGISSLLIGARFQVECRAEYKDPATGVIVPVKTLIDVEPSDGGMFNDGLADLKTVRFGHTKVWPKVVRSFRYHAQAAMYLDVYNAATNQERTGWYWFGCESEKPFEPFKEMASQEILEAGRMMYRNALARYAHCLATNVWPGYAHNAPKQFNGFNMTNFNAPWMFEDDDAIEIEATVETNQSTDPDDIIP